MHPIDRPEPLSPTRSHKGRGSSPSTLRHCGNIIQRTLAVYCPSSSLPATNAKRLRKGAQATSTSRSGAIQPTGSLDEQRREHDAPESHAIIARLPLASRSPPLQGSFRASLRSRIATCRQNRPARSRRTRDKTTRRQIETLAQHL